MPPDAVAEALDGGEAPEVRRADRAHPADVVLVDRGDHVRGERGHARRHARHTVQHDNAPHAPRERGEEPLRAPRAQQPDADHADLGAPGDLAEHHPPRGVRGSPHRDDDRGRIRRAGVLKEAARALPPLPPNGSLDVCNRLFHAARDSVKDLVAGLKKRPVLPRHHRPRAVSGVRNGRRRRAADHGVGGARCRGGGCRAAALGTGNAVQREQAHRRELVRELHPLHAVDDRVRKTVRRDVGERRVELRVGDGLGDQHGRVREVGDGPEVAVVGLDGHRLPRERAVDQVEDEREPRPADLGEHGEHQEQPLRRREGGDPLPLEQRPERRPADPDLALHHQRLHHLASVVRGAAPRPLGDPVRGRRRRRDRVQERRVREVVRAPRNCLVPVHHGNPSLLALRLFVPHRVLRRELLLLRLAQAARTRATQHGFASG